MNGVAPNDRYGICAALSREANRIFNTQAKDYPSNVLDVVGWNLRSGENDLLYREETSQRMGMELPDLPEPAPYTAPAAPRPTRQARG